MSCNSAVQQTGNTQACNATFLVPWKCLHGRFFRIRCGTDNSSVFDRVMLLGISVNTVYLNVYVSFEKIDSEDERACARDTEEFDVEAPSWLC